MRLRLFRPALLLLASLGLVVPAAVASASAVPRADEAAVEVAAVPPTDFDAIGERRFFTYDEHELNDKMTAKVNVANGNLLLSATDLNITGTGLDAGVQRFYNSHATGENDPARLGPGWVLGDSPTVRLLFPTPDQVVVVGPSGYRVTFNRNGAGDFVRAEPGLDAALRFDAGTNTYVLDWFSKDRMVFNNAGRMLRSEDKQGNTITYTYTVAGDLDFLTDTQGRRIDFTYAAGRLDKVTDLAGGRTFDYTYAQVAGDSRLVSSAVTSYGLGSDPVNLNQPTLYAYDADGRLTQVTDPEGNKTRFTYDGATARVKTLTRVTADTGEPDPTTTFAYPGSDPRCPAATSVSTVNGPRTDVTDVTTYCVDDFDRVINTIDAKGHPRTSTYTGNSNVEDFNDSGTGGASFAYGWSADDNLESLTLPTNGESTAAYDDTANPHFPTAVRDFATAGASPATWAYDYDPRGNLIEANNTPATVMYRYCYNGFGLIQRLDTPPVTTALDNDPAAGCGTASQGSDTLFTYNAAGNLTTINPPGPNGTQTFTYDAVSRVKTMTDGRGVVTTFTYDALDRIIKRAYDDPNDNLPGVATISYEFDANGNLLRRNDASGLTDFDYDELNRLIREEPDEHNEVVSYKYDTASNMVELRNSEQPNAVRYAYNNLNLATSVTDQRGRVTEFAYDDHDHRVSTVYPNGVTMKQAFDESHRLTCTYGYTGPAPGTGPNGCPTPSTGLLTFFSYDYMSPNGRDTRTRYEEVDRNNQTTTYSYDAIQRLTRARTLASGGGEVRDFEYLLQDRGNISRETVTGSGVPNQVTTLAYNNADELCWRVTATTPSTCASPPAGATTYAYDNAGNLDSSSNGLDFAYNLQEQTVEIDPPGGGPFMMAYADSTSDWRTEAGETRFTYNQLGLGTQGENSGTDQNTWFNRDPEGTLVSRVNEESDEGEDLFYLFDGLGSVAATTDEDGNLVTRYTYEPYGEQISPDPTLMQDGEPVDKNPWRYASGYYDTKTGMLKFGTRYYMPNVMRWTQRDPVMGKPDDPMTLNPYIYVGGNPVNTTDRTGRFFHEEELTWGDIGDLALSQVTGTLAGGSVAASCAGIVTAVSGGTLAAPGAVACIVGGRVYGIWVSRQAESELDQ
jgi:RHS repeat-associated protein